MNMSASSFPTRRRLTAADLQSARRQTDDRSELVLERRGIAADRDPFSFVYAKVDRSAKGEMTVTVRANLSAAPGTGADGAEKLYLDPINVNPPHISTDKSVKYDYDIVYVPRAAQGRPGA